MSVRVKCPRCDPERRGHGPQGHEGNAGYLFWDDETLTDAERKAIQDDTGGPDGDNEVPCPLCEGEGDVDEEAAVTWATPPKEPAIRGLDWAGVPEDSPDVPMPKFRFDWVDDGNANVIAVQDPPNEAVRIGLLSFDGNSWCFVRIDRTGDQLVGADTIECDTGTEDKLRQAHEEALMAQKGPTQRAMLKAVDVQCNLYRDDSRDVAELGARIVARKWWRIFWIPEN